MANKKHLPFIQFLQNLADIPTAEIKKATGLFQPTQIKKNTFFIRGGETPKNIAFLISGLMRLYYIDPNGTEFTKSFCVENDVVAAYSALLLNEPSRLFIQALEDSVLLVAPYSAYKRLINSHICWQQINHKLTETLFIKKEKRESQLLLDDAQTRYMTFLAEYPSLDKRLKQHHIASYLGIKPQSLSRIRKKKTGE